MSSYYSPYGDPNASSSTAYQQYENQGYLSNPLYINTSSMTQNPSQQSDSSYGSGSACTQQYPVSPYDTASPYQAQYSYTDYNNGSYFAPSSDAYAAQHQTGSAAMEPSHKSKKAYPCLVIGCTSNSVFKRCADLERHMDTVHFPKYTDCPYAANWCNRVGERGFTRSDHLKDHLRDVHAKDIPKQQRGNKGKK